jgi:hypothetical protein
LNCFLESNQNIALSSNGDVWATIAILVTPAGAVGSLICIPACALSLGEAITPMGCFFGIP